MASGSSSGGAPVFDRERPPADRSHARRRRPAPDWGGDELFDHVPRRRFAPTPEEPAAGQSSAPEAGANVAARSPRLHGARNRPRTGSVEERVTASPDRIAAWAFALGLLLILVAIATSV